MNKLQYYNVLLGCDPEFFFSKNGKIIGSEKVLPKEGIISVNYPTSKIIIDGIQAELNPTPSTCRQSLASFITDCFKQLNNQMIKDKELSLDFTGVIKMEEADLDALSEKSKIFGCEPSQNFYDGSESKITVNPKKYLYRSAGGHIHLGYADGLSINSKYMSQFVFSKKVPLRNFNSLKTGECEGISIHTLNKDTIIDENIKKFYGINKIDNIVLPPVVKALQQPDKLIPLLDIIVGNTCVLLDRDEGNIERRKVYGKAGEYRLPYHGLEYRTLSNFWLRSYQLMSLVFGLSRLAVIILVNSVSNKEYYNAIIEKVQKDEIEKAINENDYDLAYKNFLKINKTILEMTKQDTCYSYFQGMSDNFEYFVKKGINYWFKENPLTHWLKETRTYGWERFITETVPKDMVKV